MKAFITILRETGATIIRVPLLWFFSAFALVSALITSGLFSQGLTTRSLLLMDCILLLLFPVMILAMAGQIKVVQLHYEGTPTSISQVIRHGARRFWSLVGVYSITIILTLLFLILLWLLWFLARLLFPQIPRPEMWFFVFLSGAIANILGGFAQRGIVISDLSVKASLPIVFQVLRKDAFTVLTLATVFGGLRYFGQLNNSLTAYSISRIVIINLAFLVMEVIQSTVYTLVYLHFVGGTQPSLPEIQAQI